MQGASLAEIDNINDNNIRYYRYFFLNTKINKMAALINIAAKNAKYKNFRQEFGLGIIVTIGVRFLTAGISIFAGYFYFSNLMSSLNSENKYIPIILAVLLLIVIEFFSAWLLSKLTKSIMQAKWIRAFILLVFAVGTFTASFISSTNGLSMRQSKKADNTVEIVSLFNTEQKNIKARYEVLIIELKKQINVEKKNPAGWRNGKRYYLTASQLKRISNVNQSIKAQRDLQREEISALTIKKNTEIKSNRIVMISTADKYYKFIAIILIISALSNIALQVFYRKIFREEKAQLAAISDVNVIRQDVMNSLWDTINREAGGMRKIVTEHLAIQNTIQDGDDIKQIVADNTEKDKTKSIGFAKNQNIDFNANNEIEGTVNDKSTVGTVNVPIKKNCSYCGKDISHKLHWNAKYCDVKCRKSAWEQKNNKKLTF